MCDCYISVHFITRNIQIKHNHHQLFHSPYLLFLLATSLFIIRTFPVESPTLLVKSPCWLIYDDYINYSRNVRFHPISLKALRKWWSGSILDDREKKTNMGIDVNISMSTSKDGDWTNKAGDLTGKVRMINGDLTNKKQQTWWLNQQSWGVKQQATFGFAEHWGIQYLFSFHVGKIIIIHWTLTNNGEWNNRHGFSHQSHGFSQ